MNEEEIIDEEVEDDEIEDDLIECDCNDPSCPKEGREGEVGGHIEDCTCADCHRELGKVSG